jgi:hypothetical protein
VIADEDKTAWYTIAESNPPLLLKVAVSEFLSDGTGRFQTSIGLVNREKLYRFEELARRDLKHALAQDVLRARKDLADAESRVASMVSLDATRIDPRTNHEEHPRLTVGSPLQALQASRLTAFLAERGGVGSVSELSDFFETSESFVRRWARSNNVRRCGGVFVFDAEAARALLDAVSERGDDLNRDAEGRNEIEVVEP